MNFEKRWKNLQNEENRYRYRTFLGRTKQFDVPHRGRLSLDLTQILKGGTFSFDLSLNKEGLPIFRISNGMLFHLLIIDYKFDIFKLDSIYSIVDSLHDETDSMKIHER